MHPGLEAYAYHEHDGCAANPGDRSEEDRGGSGECVPPSPSAFRQRTLLPLQGSEGLPEPQAHRTHPLCTLPPDDPGQDRMLSSLDEECGEPAELLFTRRSGAGYRPVRGLLQQLALS